MDMVERLFAPDEIWLVGHQSGDVVWSREPTPLGAEPGGGCVRYVRLPGGLAADYNAALQ